MSIKQQKYIKDDPMHLLIQLLPKRFIKLCSLLIFFLVVSLSPLHASSNTITVEASQNAITINGLSSVQLQALALLTDFGRRSIISVYISDDYYPESTIALGVLGETLISREGFRFIPVTPFTAGQQYLLVFSLLPLGEVLIHEEFFTIRIENDGTAIAKPLDDIFNTIRLRQSSTNSNESLTIRPFTNAITISGLSPTQTNEIAQLGKSKLNEVISIYELESAALENKFIDQIKDENSRKKLLPGIIMIKNGEIKFIPNAFLTNEKRYLLVFSLAPINQVLYHEEIFSLLTAEELLDQGLPNMTKEK